MMQNNTTSIIQYSIPDIVLSLLYLANVIPEIRALHLKWINPFTAKNA